MKKCFLRNSENILAGDNWLHLDKPNCIVSGVKLYAGWSFILTAK